MLLVLALIAPIGRSARAATFTDTYQRYNVWWPGCNIQGGLYGNEPDTGSGYPVFVWAMGSYGSYNGVEAQKFTREAAARGFVAGSASYDSVEGLSDAAIDGKARCIYNGSVPASAVARLCARPKADCSKGIVGAGFSQGGAITLRAANHDARVRAAYALGVSGPLNPGLIAQPAGVRALPNDRLRITTGQKDVERSGTSALDAITGNGCAPNWGPCFRGDGSGYYIVQNFEVADGVADHCFFEGGGKCSVNPPFDPNWPPPSQVPWALAPNLDWLKAHTG
jgi:dienelactone hydrolase